MTPRPPSGSTRFADHGSVGAISRPTATILDPLRDKNREVILEQSLRLVDHHQFTEFHNYLFESQANYSQSLAKAKLMLDNTTLDSVLRSAPPRDYVSKHVALYQEAGAGQIPKLLFIRTATVGAVKSSSAMIQLIEQHVAC